MFYLVRKFFSPDPENKGTEEKQEIKEEKSGQKEDNVALAKALKEARENSVSKEEFDKLKEENERLVSEIINGSGAGNGQPAPEEQQADIAQLREELYGPKCAELSNLQYWEKTLALREAIMKQGDADPFLPVGSKISPTAEDTAKAQNVADVVKSCIEQAEGNSEVFTALLQSKINNDSPVMTAHLKKLGIKYK